MYKQIIIVRKDLDLSPGKFAGQVAHASMAFLTNMIRKKAYPAEAISGIPTYKRDAECYKCELTLSVGLYEEWINDIFTKVVLRAKNKNQLLKAKEMAEALGMRENEDFFLIKDCCKTELEPEEIDENGIGRTLTCIGLKPFPVDVIDKIAKKYQLYS